jgi:hypothetical protein
MNIMQIKMGMKRGLPHIDEGITTMMRRRRSLL